MKNWTKKVFLLVLAIILIVSTIPMSASAATYTMTWDAYWSKVNEFINDSQWADGSPYGDEQKEPKLSNYGSESCCAYTADFVKYVFDANSPRGGDVFYDPSEIRAGDVLILGDDAHWLVVLNRDGDKLYTAEGNYHNPSDSQGIVKISESKYYMSGSGFIDKANKTFSYGYHFLNVIADETPTISIPDSAVEFNGHYYQAYKMSVSWTEAKSYCEKLGGHLATITSAEEQAFIESLNTGRMWIGGYRDDNFNWYWVTGEKWDYTNWDTGEPNNSSNVVRNENCVAIWPRKWNDLNENNKREQNGFICEWDPIITVDPPTEDCTCKCHSGGFVKFVWKIGNFFRRLFRMNDYSECACGDKHW